MSTFNDLVQEFPDIRIDFFRLHPDRRPPRACFLSHVHSDHLTGLESLKSPFVYCSAATKELLLRLERYPHRLNFARGILESRKQEYKHLKNLLKPIPLETPTAIELEPGNTIKVTLFDANHCTGAVMFLIEGNGQAILYTGDIRSEPWFVNNLTRNPILIEYVTGLKTLDCIYLDTSHTDPTVFPTKADGLKELLQKVAQYPPETTFHFAAWTFGYEEVWVALARALGSDIHVDNYKLRLYQSLRGDSADKTSNSGSILAYEGLALAGYTCGNTPQPGCLTNDHTVRLHSCEKGMHCPAINDKTVWIQPIIARTKHGAEIAEVGVGGGGGDLNQRSELELDNGNMIEQLISLVAKPGSRVLQEVKHVLSESLRTHRNMIPFEDVGLQIGKEELSIVDFLEVLAELIHKHRTQDPKPGSTEAEKAKVQELPNVITFPYSRHSSLDELCHLVSVFKPRDVFPCTVDEERWHEGISMQTLFGEHSSGVFFRHDAYMRSLKVHAEEQTQMGEQQTQTTVSSLSSPVLENNITTPIRMPQHDASHRPYRFRKDATGKLISLDTDGNVDASTPRSRGNTVGISPCSTSQSLRRKVIVDGLEESPSKRARIQYDGPASAPTSIASADMNLSTTADPSHSVPVEMVGVSFGPCEASETDDDDDYDGGNEPYWDKQDGVFRCSRCGWETWATSDSPGFCNGCGVFDQNSSFGPMPYREGEYTKRPVVIYENDYVENELGNEEREELLGDFLDDELSAYDSYDEEGRELQEEYEQNSFIDDEDPIPDYPDQSDTSSESSEEETDYKEKFYTLREQYGVLLKNHTNLINEHEEFRRDVLGSDYAESYEESLDEDDMLVVDVKVADPALAEVVLSHREEDSQVNDDRVKDRLAAAEAAVDEDGQGWHNISLTSTTGNHTFPEIEL